MVARGELSPGKVLFPNGHGDSSTCGEPGWDRTRDFGDPKDQRIDLGDFAIIAKNRLLWLLNP
jgi:hypothetical protein